MSEMTCGRTRSRSLLGTLNDFSLMTRVAFVKSHGEPLEDIASVGWNWLA